MPAMRSFLTAAVLAVVLPFTAHAAPVLPGLGGGSSAETEPKAAPATDPAQRFAEQTQANETALAELKQQLAEAPKRTRDAEQALTQLKNSAVVDVAKRFGGLSVEQLESRLAERMEQVADWQKALTDANSLIIAAQTRPERAQAEISSSQARIQEINSFLKSGRESGKPLTDERRELLTAELAALSSLIELRRQELAGNSLLQELGKSLRDLMSERIGRAEQESLALQTLINQKRQAQSEQTVAELSRQAEKAGSDTLLAEQRAENLKLSDYLLRATERLNRLTRDNLETRQQLDALNQADQTLEEQIGVLEGSLLLSKILYQQQQALPQIDLDTNLADEIADIRLYQFELNQEREQRGTPEAYVDRLLAAQPADEVTPELRRALVELVRARSELLDRLNRELSALLNESITLQLNQKQLQDRAHALSETLEEQMFWIPSNKPLDWSWFRSVPRLLENQLKAIPWRSALEKLADGLLERPLLFLPLLLLIAALLWRRRAINDKLEALSQDVGHYRRDSQLHTPLALLLNLLLALPVALFLALCGYLLQMDARGQNYGLGAALFEMAQAWLVFYTAYRMLSPGRVAELHFGWSKPQVAFLRDRIRRLGFVVLALVAVVNVAEHQPASLAEDVLGIAVVIACYGLMSWGLVRVLRKGPASENAPPLRVLIGLAFSLLPLALIGVVAMGYYYTALKLTDRLIDTLYVIMLWVALEATVVRSLTVAARRLAYQRMLARRQAQAEQGDGIEAGGEAAMDIEQVNQQSLRLARLALLGLFLAALYWVWADLISVVSYLDNVTLYQFTSADGTSTDAISLSNLLSAVLIIAITIALARNLPGLLEVLVLSRLQLAQGSAYATATLLSYALVAIGAVSTLSTLGVSWDKLQWLVAALSVGLGFGLQEIFANFVSGLIILFERPVRIGDVVTIGNLSGTVSRIRIRATTITDFDHKEIIVPNKTFITNQLINWSLSDTVTRVTVRIGVAYGSDLELVRRLLLQAAEENPRVLPDPEPQVFFLAFGESNLDHELRIHVRKLDDRNPAIDEINRFLDRELVRHGVIVDFRRVDVFLRNGQGQEVQLDGVRTLPAGPDDAAQPRA